jgi:hypothetical protein
MGPRLPVGHHPAIDTVRGMRTPSQTAGPFFLIGPLHRAAERAARRHHPDRRPGLRRGGRADRRLPARALEPRARVRPLPHRRRRPLLVPRPR